MSGELLFGSFQLNRESSTPGVPWKTKALREGTTRGNPEPIEVTVESWLRDGAIVITQGYNNRDMNMNVKITGDSQDGLAAGEAALFGEVGKPNTLSWTPNVALAKTAVFVVVTSSLRHADDRQGAEIAEVAAKPSAVYGVRLVCEAFVRSASEIVATALAASGTTTTLVDNGSATTGWTATVNGTAATPAVVSGAVGVTTAAMQGTVTIALTRTGAITTSSTKYLVVDWSGGGSLPLRAFGDGVELQRTAEAVSPTAGYTRTWFGPVAAASIAVLRLDCTTTPPGTLGPTGATIARSLQIDNINRTDIKPGIGTARQLLRSIDVAGSARSPGAIAIEHATSSLGDVLAYFFPDAPETIGYSPPLRQYRVSGGTVTSDANMVSGASENIVTGFSADIPVTRLAPGPHLLMVRCSTSGGSLTSAAITYDVETRVGGFTLLTTSGSFPWPLSGNMTVRAIARLNLPTLDIGPAGVVRISLGATVFTTGVVTMDEAWLFNTRIGQLVQVACGVGAPGVGAANRLFLQPPTVRRPRPTMRAGVAADGSDSYYPMNVPAWQFPLFPPPRVNVLTVTTNALDASVTLRHTPAHFGRPTI